METTMNNSSEIDIKDEPLVDPCNDEQSGEGTSDQSKNPDPLNIEDLPEDYFADLIGLDIVDEWEATGGENEEEDETEDQPSKQVQSDKPSDDSSKVLVKSEVNEDDEDTIPFNETDDKNGTPKIKKEEGELNMSIRLRKELAVDPASHSESQSTGKSKSGTSERTDSRRKSPSKGNSKSPPGKEKEKEKKDQRKSTDKKKSPTRKKSTSDRVPERRSRRSRTPEKRRRSKSPEKRKRSRSPERKQRSRTPDRRRQRTSEKKDSQPSRRERRRRGTQDESEISLSPEPPTGPPPLLSLSIVGPNNQPFPPGVSPPRPLLSLSPHPVVSLSPDPHRSPLRRSFSPRRRLHSRSPVSTRRHSRSPRRRSRSPRRRSRSPRRMSRSPRRRSHSRGRSYSRSPRRRSYSRSPRRSHSPRRRSRSPQRNSANDDHFLARLRSRRVRQMRSGSRLSSRSRSRSHSRSRSPTPKRKRTLSPRSPTPERKRVQLSNSSPWARDMVWKQEIVETPAVPVQNFNYSLPFPAAGQQAVPQQYGMPPPMIVDPSVYQQQQQQQQQQQPQQFYSPGPYNPPFAMAPNYIPGISPMMNLPQPVPAPALVQYPGIVGVPLPESNFQVQPPQQRQPTPVPTSSAVSNFPEASTSNVPDRPALRVVNIASMTSQTAPVSASEPYQLESSESSDSDQDDRSGIPKHVSLSRFLEATMQGREGKKAPFKPLIFKQVEHAIESLEADATMMQPYRFSVRPSDSPSARTLASVSTEHPSKLLEEARTVMSFTTRPINTKSIKLIKNPKFAPPERAPTPLHIKSILKAPVKTTVSIGVNTDPMPEPEVPSCLECEIQKEKRFMNRWTQTKPPTRQSAYTQAGRDLQDTHNPVVFRKTGMPSRGSTREVLLVNDETVPYTLPPLPIRHRAPVPPSPPRYDEDYSLGGRRDYRDEPYREEDRNYDADPHNYRDLDTPRPSDVRSRLAPRDEQRFVRYEGDSYY